MVKFCLFHGMAFSPELCYTDLDLNTKEHSL